MSSAGAFAGLIGVLAGAWWADPVAGLAVTAFICHVGWEVSSDVAHHLMDGVDPNIVTTAEAVAATVPGIRHAHAHARWTGRTLRVEVEGWVDPDTSVGAADELGREVSQRLRSGTAGDALIHLDDPWGLVTSATGGGRRANAM